MLPVFKQNVILRTGCVVLLFTVSCLYLRFSEWHIRHQQAITTIQLIHVSAVTLWPCIFLFLQYILHSVNHRVCIVTLAPGLIQFSLFSHFPFHNLFSIAIAPSSFVSHLSMPMPPQYFVLMDCFLHFSLLCCCFLLINIVTDSVVLSTLMSKTLIFVIRQCSVGICLHKYHAQDKTHVRSLSSVPDSLQDRTWAKIS